MAGATPPGGETAPAPPGGETAGVIAPPPVIFAVALLVGWLLGFVVAPPVLPSALSWLGALLAVLALALGGASLLALRRAGTAVDPYRPSTALVRTGPFRFSRNPIYVGLTALSLGLALLAGSLWMMLLLVPAVALLRQGVVAREEAYLGRKFGDEYRRYTEEVRRWL